jgi:alkanesulfonate monooxygenase SsuD/methylene tetrahydromethanopterin reductase-like flavin-dependent oxidoreductase (luciferase family)
VPGVRPFERRQRPEPTLEEIEARIQTGFSPYGTPDEVTKVMTAYESAGADQVVFGLLSSTMSRELAVEIIETFGTHVLPKFDKDPVHRTDRMRGVA